MPFFRPFAVGLILLSAQLTASAAEVAVLRNGSSLTFTRKEVIGSTTRLYLSSGYLDLPTSEIVSFDQEETPAPEANPVPIMHKAEKPVTPVSLELKNAPVSVARRPLLKQEELDRLVREASARNRLDPDFVASVIKAESNFKIGAVSAKGARGLMQLMPGTAAQLGVADAFDPKSNIEAGTAHLSALLDRYHDDPIKALAAYNAGAGRVEQYHGLPPYRETRAYVTKIVRDFNAKKRAQMKPAATKSAGNETLASKSSPAAHKARSGKTQPQQASLQKPVKPA